MTRAKLLALIAAGLALGAGFATVAQQEPAPAVDTKNPAVYASILPVGALAPPFDVTNLVFGLKVRPLRGEALLLEAPPPPAPLFAGEGYLLPREGGVYLGATGREGWGRGVDLFGLRWLSDYGHERFPLLEEARFRGVLWGYRPLGEVFVGEVDQGVYAATGHGRNGVLLAPWTARRILELMGVKA